MRRVLSFALLGILPLGIVRALPFLADAAGRTLAVPVVLASQWLAVHRATSSAGVASNDWASPKGTEDDKTSWRAVDGGGGIAAAPSSGARAVHKKNSAARKRELHGVFVPASTVLRLAQGRAIPSAVPVPAEGARPSGLRLVGVSGLGVGLRDGDVLTSVMGAPALSVPDVVRCVISARARAVREISGEFWRNGERWHLVVEQPYIGETKAP
jgi:hypothetical protein